ncbi:MAG: dihydroorotate dehydrogenase electron transfer subunit [Actinobacteria bacterium]|nr:dihydroorotate dehydrogenase electron transfer subunit [Actinomycetota bacterium]
MKTLKGEIVANRKYSDNLYKLEVFSPYICKNAKPAQFINIKCSRQGSDDPLLRRPFSIYEIDEQFNVFSVLFLVRGRGTQFMADLRKGESLDFVGPLGQPIKIPENDSRFVLIGGGIGVVPLCLIAKNLKSIGKTVHFFAGFKDEAFYTWERDLIKILKDYKIFSENGVFGEKGIPLNYIRENFSEFKDHHFIVCGPLEMLKQAQSFLKDRKVRAIAIMEEKMACGIGACMGCVIKIKNKNNGYSYKKVCSDGPAFDLMEVCFD